ncbi:MAG: ATP-binding cassette domain-containing protein [Desulfuromonadaceae bacterium]|nr:ATP-binding cassette domain-containing protein [Desulfuromonadaceae bacterium]MDD2849816.1 ATP-binding cassette domain-containing protein [Desulfuromonadaceae bacterium]MDD4129328.1 ATP-binding cassette domain-containing protein [Desulfuromonadaceae bacterium]
MPEKSIVLRTDLLSRSIQNRKLVDDITVEVRAGEVLAVVGSSGSGKSSFLRLLNRLDEPSSGTVFLEDIDYRTIPPCELRRKVGMVTQRAFLFPGTVYENLQFGPKQRGEELSENLAQELLDGVGLSSYLMRDVTHLSGGEAQRISIARALANTPSVLLLDEPTSALDDESKSGVEGLLHDIIRKRRLTCVMVTHDVAQAARMATHVMMLADGRVIKEGTVKEVLHA